MSDNYFVSLNNINVNDKTEKKNGLTYLSWAWAWGEVKKMFPDATYTIYENPDGWFYFTDGRTCWVKTGVTVNGIEHIEYLPVMDFRNASIPADKVTSFDVNKAIQRSLTKAVARHGLGLYIYAGEDLPEAEWDEEPQKPTPKQTPKPAPKPAAPPAEPKPFVKPEVFRCEKCGQVITPYTGANGKEVSVEKHIEASRKKMEGKVFCVNCIKDYIGGNKNA
jgi:hypothetical protein